MIEVMESDVKRECERAYLWLVWCCASGGGVPVLGSLWWRRWRRSSWALAGWRGRLLDVLLDWRDVEVESRERLGLSLDDVAKEANQDVIVGVDE
jgi:hypothetical protein